MSSLSIHLSTLRYQLTHLASFRQANKPSYHPQLHRPQCWSGGHGRRILSLHCNPHTPQRAPLLRWVRTSRETDEKHPIQQYLSLLRSVVCTYRLLLKTRSRSSPFHPMTQTPTSLNLPTPSSSSMTPHHDVHTDFVELVHKERNTGNYHTDKRPHNEAPIHVRCNTSTEYAAVHAIVPRPEEQELLIPGKLTSRQRQLADSCRTREAPRSTRENLQRRVVRNAINLLSAWCDADSRNCTASVSFRE